MKYAAWIVPLVGLLFNIGVLVYIFHTEKQMAKKLKAFDVWRRERIAEFEREIRRGTKW